jgi:branched-chain amino acid transport system substrate-binding protein
VGGTDKEKVTDALKNTKHFLGVTGDTTMDADHNPVKDAVILRAKNGQWEYVTTVKP